MAGEQALGHGVAIRELADGTLLVASDTLDLPLTPPHGAVPGTAVDVAGELWEVVAAPAAGAPRYWTLRPWPATTAMRGGVRLDAATIAGWQRAAAVDAAAQRRRTMLLPLLPLLGVAPQRVQQQWADSWAFPAGAATVSSIVVELGAGVLGAMALGVAAFGGGHLLPRGLGWLGPAGPLLMFEGLGRFVRWASSGEPIGAMVGLPIALFVPRPTVAPVVAPRPTVVACDEELLVLLSPIARGDWNHGGELQFRDRRWRLAAANAEGTAWRYQFTAVAADEPPADALALAPPASRLADATSPVRAGLGLARLLVGTLMALFASPPFLRRWCPYFGFEPRTATLVGASIELCGALLNLTGPAAVGAAWLLLVDIAVFLDGGVRLAAALVGGGPVGSILGVPFEVAVDRWLAQHASFSAPPPAR